MGEKRNADFNVIANLQGRHSAKLRWCDGGSEVATWAFWRRVLVAVEIDSSGDRLRNMAQLDRHSRLSEKLAQRYRPDVDVCAYGFRVANSL